nr:hypothetical protein [Tanacetum cinerariifolium]
VLTQSKQVSNTAVRPVSAALHNITMTRPKYDHHVITKSKSPNRRHITRSPSSKTSTLPLRVTAVKAPVGNPQQALKDKGVIDNGCSRYMTANMSYLSDFVELNEGYVTFGGNPKGGKITGKGKIKTASPKSNSSGKRRNKNACFVCKSVDHLIKDSDFHTKKMAQPTPRTYAYRGHHKQYALLTYSKPQKHMVPPAVLTQSKQVSNTAVRPVSAALHNITMTRPKYDHHVITKSKSPNVAHRVTAVKAPVVSAAQGKQGTWEWKP